MVRIGRDHGLPRHFEGCQLAAWARALGWPLAALACVGGIWLFVAAGSQILEALAALVVLAGVVLVVGLVRCRRHELTVGERMVELRCGPYRHTLPVGSIEHAEPRPATGWRRLYAGRELVLTTSLDRGPLPVPTLDEAELHRALVGP